MYLFEEPVVLALDDKIEVTCTYDTSRDAAPITPGFATEEEMCLVGLLASRG